MNRVKVLAVPGQVNGLKCSERRAKIRVVSMRLTTAIKILAMVRNLTYLKLTYNLPPIIDGYAYQCDIYVPMNFL